eukprot:3907909-Amphidinium_carterae.1
MRSSVQKNASTQRATQAHTHTHSDAHARALVRLHAYTRAHTHTRSCSYDPDRPVFPFWVAWHRWAQSFHGSLVA